MSNDIMLAFFSGRLVKDPEQRQTSDGTSIALFTVAINRKRRNGEEIAEFADCVAYGAQADTLTLYAHKGTALWLRAEWETRKWTGRDGQERRRLEYSVKEFGFLGDRQTGGESKETPPAAKYGGDSAESAPQFSPLSLDADLPF